MSVSSDRLTPRTGPKTSPPRKKLSGPAAIAANVGMFIVTAVVCFGLIRGVKSFASASAPSQAYVLTTTRVIEAGEPLSKANAVWRRLTGRPPQGAIVGGSPDADVTLYAAAARLGSDKPVRSALVKKQPPVTLRASAELAGFVLSGNDVDEILPYLKAGDRVDVVAVVSGGRESSEAQVSTLIAGARVVALAPGVGGRMGRQASAVIGVTDEQARLLTLLRTQTGRFSLVLSPLRLNEADAPETVWRGGSAFGLPASSEPAKPLAIAATTPSASRQTAESEAAPKVASEGQFVTVITAAGATHAAVE